MTTEYVWKINTLYSEEQGVQKLFRGGHMV